MGSDGLALPEIRAATSSLSSLHDRRRYEEVDGDDTPWIGGSLSQAAWTIVLRPARRVRPITRR